MWRYNRVVYGNRKRTYTPHEELGDRNGVEARTRVPLCRRMRAVGRNPAGLRGTVETSRRERRRKIGK